jgi:quinol monooxygenase YgiN
MIANIATFRARPGAEAELGRLLAQLAARALARENSGIHDFTLLHSATDAQRFVLYETLDSEADLERHRATPAVKEFREKSDGLVEELVTEIFEVVPAEISTR